MNEVQYLSIRETANKLGVSPVTLRRWDKSGYLKSSYRTSGNHRRYNINDVMKIINPESQKKE